VVRKPLEPETLREIPVPSNPQLAPNKNLIAYTLTWPDTERNEYIDEMRIIDAVMGQEKAVIRQPGITGHRWSPSGSRLVYTSRDCAGKDEKPATCLYVYTVGAPGPRLAARLPFQAYLPRWLSERTVALLATRGKEGGTEEDYVIIEGLPVWVNGAGFVADKNRHIVLVDVETGNYEWVTEGKLDVESIEAANDGRIVAVVTPSRLRPYIQEVWLIDVASGEKEIVVPSSEGWSIHTAALTPEGLLVWGHQRPRGEASHYHVWLRSLDDGETLCLSCGLDLDTFPSVQSDTFWLRGSPVQPQWSRRGIYFLANHGGRLWLHRARPGEEPETLVEGELAVYGYTVHVDGDMVALAYSDPVTPGEIAVWREDKGVVRLTSLSSWLRERYKLSVPKRLVIKASDGVEVEGWYLEPPEGAGSPPFPVVLHVHGGPKSSYGPFFVFQHQLLASRGYYVVYANPRGSSGYSEEFADIRCHYGERDYMDIMEFLDAFLEATRGRSDPSRVAITGISYGGFMTNWAVARSDKFAAAVSENGISWWMSDYYTSDIGYWFDPDQICGTPSENPENYWRQSPLRYVDNIKTPVLIIHSMEDYRCFIEQALALHTELVLRGRESRLVVFRSGDHGFSVRGKPRTRVKRLKLILEFLEEKLGGQSRQREG